MVSVEIEYLVAQLFVEVKSSHLIVLFYFDKRRDKVEYKNNVWQKNDYYRCY